MFPALPAALTSSLAAFLLAIALVAAAIGGGAWSLSPRGRAFFDDLAAAMKVAHGKLMVAAIELGYSGPELSRYLNPTRPNILTRLAEDEAIERELVVRRAVRLGLRVIDADVAAVLDDAVRSKRMAKMETERAS
jgi:hypothetical protein